MKLNPKHDMTHLENMLAEKGYRYICGVDEVGRGPLAGPVVAAAVIMPPDIQIEGLNDSKKLSSMQRERIFEEIAELGLVCAVGVIDHECIDKINILKASLMAMRKAVMDLKQAPDIVLVDGNYPVPNIAQPQFAVVGGDGQCQSIAAASIVAKITRDRIMDRYQALYPSFSFSKHKGYPTPEHLEELRMYGPTEIHRRSFKPVAELVNQYALF
ncbi:MAG: ribonuclease HII [Candidatus Zixiibacteriota bacterium]